MDRLHTFQHHQKQVNSLWNFYSIYIRMTCIRIYSDCDILQSHLARSWVVDCHDRSASGCTCSIQSPSSHGWRTAAFLGIAWLVQDPSTTKWCPVDFGGFPLFFLDFAPFPSWASTWINQHAVWIHPINQPKPIKTSRFRGLYLSSHS